MVTTRAIWILGTPFSGSTMVQLLIGRFRKVFVAGEIDRIAAFNMHPHLASDSNCYLRACAYCRANGLDCEIWRPAVFEELSQTGCGPSVYDILARESGKEIVLDASKTPWWFLNVSRHPDFALWKGRIFAILCVRNPFAFSVSMARRTGQSLESCAFTWVQTNRDALHVIQTCGHFLPVLTLYHNRVLRDPDGMLTSLAKWCDLGELTVQDNLHYLGGNVAAWPFTAKPEQSTPQFDESKAYFAHIDAVADDDGRWREKIDPGMRWRLAGLPGVRDISAIFGIDIDALVAS